MLGNKEEPDFRGIIESNNDCIPADVVELLKHLQTDGVWYWSCFEVDTHLKGGWDGGTFEEKIKAILEAYDESIINKTGGCLNSTVTTKLPGF